MSVVDSKINKVSLSLFLMPSNVSDDIDNNNKKILLNALSNSASFVFPKSFNLQYVAF